MDTLVDTLLPYFLSLVTVTVMWLAGNKDRRAWILGIVAQGFWLVFIVNTQSWGLVPLTAAMVIVYSRNLRAWKPSRVRPLTQQLANAGMVVQYIHASKDRRPVAEVNAVLSNGPQDFTVNVDGERLRGVQAFTLGPELNGLITVRAPDEWEPPTGDHTLEFAIAGDVFWSAHVHLQADERPIDGGRRNAITLTIEAAQRPAELV